MIVRRIITAALLTAMFCRGETGRIQGRVMDANGARVPGIRLEIMGPGKTQAVSADWEGRYHVQLEEGTYTITAPRSTGFMLFRRGAVRVPPKSDLVVNIGLFTGPPHINYVGEPPKSDFRGPEYDRFQPDFERGLDVVVRYTNRVVRAGINEYSGSYSGPAMLTYDTLTLCADKLTLDTTTFLAAAEGHVVIEGTSRIEVTSATVDLRERMVTFRTGSSESSLHF